MEKIKAKIYTTTAYDKFKILFGNREVPRSKTLQLIKSIKENGYILNPILVNENFEIIDGQGRFSALKELEMPIDYYIVPDAKIKECIVLNVNSKNWTTYDFIKSYADQGDVNYKRLLTYTKVIPYARIYLFANGICGGSAYNATSIKDGNIVVPDDTFEKTMETLNFLKDVDAYTNQISGRALEFQKAVAFAYNCNGVDKERLKSSIEKNINIVKPMASFEGALNELTTIYNRRARSDFMFFTSEWEIFKKNKISEKNKVYLEKRKSEC